MLGKSERFVIQRGRRAPQFNVVRTETTGGRPRGCFLRGRNRGGNPRNGNPHRVFVLPDVVPEKIYSWCGMAETG